MLNKKQLCEFEKRWPNLWDKIVSYACTGVVLSSGVPLDITSVGEKYIRAAILKEMNRLTEI